MEMEPDPLWPVIYEGSGPGTHLMEANPFEPVICDGNGTKPTLARDLRGKWGRTLRSNPKPHELRCFRLCYTDVL